MKQFCLEATANDGSSARATTLLAAVREPLPLRQGLRSRAAATKNIKAIPGPAMMSLRRAAGRFEIRGFPTETSGF
jgi:hypothetical protein